MSSPEQSFCTTSGAYPSQPADVVYLPRGYESARLDLRSPLHARSILVCAEWAGAGVLPKQHEYIYT